MEEQQSLSETFEEALVTPEPFSPAELPDEWQVGQHLYMRVLWSKDALDTKLTEFREKGLRVLDFALRGGFWIFKVMAPDEEVLS